jgi:hypothetical protein
MNGAVLDMLRGMASRQVTEADAELLLTLRAMAAPVLELYFEGWPPFREDPLDRLLSAREAPVARWFKPPPPYTFSWPSAKEAWLAETVSMLFRKAFPKDQEMHGVVFTPPGIVSYMVKSVLEAVRRSGRGPEDAVWLDPFSGLGQFPAALLRALKGHPKLGFIYRERLLMNEINPFFWHVGRLNVAMTYETVTGERLPFPGARLTDTFAEGENLTSDGPGRLKGLS